MVEKISSVIGEGFVKSVLPGLILISLSGFIGWLMGYAGDTAKGAVTEATQEKRLENLETQLAKLRRYAGETASKTEYLCQREPDCDRRYEPLGIPE